MRVRDERVDNLGSVSRIVFCVPKRQERETINEVMLTLIVPTDQVADMISKLARAPSASIMRSEGEAAADEVRH